MPITKKNILFHELVGLVVEVTGSNSVTLVGLRGVVVDETMNTLLVKRKGAPEKCLKVLKDHNTFTFTLPGGKEIDVPGKLLVGRPWDRLKNIGKKQFKLTKNR
ncbi:MAG: ribonuclease P protein component 1 [Promethearchaeota archaeon]